MIRARLLLLLATLCCILSGAPTSNTAQSRQRVSRHAHLELHYQDGTDYNAA